MSKKDCIELNGVVVDVMPSTTFKVKLENEIEILCKPCGKMVMNSIKIIRGDKVKVEMSPYDLTKGRIVWRG